MWVKYIERLLKKKKKICREAKQHCNPKSLEESIAGIGKLKSIRCNCNGTKVSIMCDKVRRPKFSYFDNLSFCSLSNKRIYSLLVYTVWTYNLTSYKTNEFTAPLINIHKQNYLNIVVDIVNDLKDLLFGGSL